MGSLVAVVRGGDCAGAGDISGMLCTLGSVAGGGCLSGMCLRTRCGSFQDLVHLDVGVGKGGSIGASRERIIYFFWRMAIISSAVWRS